MSNLTGTLAAIALVCFLGACGGSSDATPPKYPYPEPRPVEETDLGVYLEEEEADDELDDAPDDDAVEVEDDASTEDADAPDDDE